MQRLEQASRNVILLLFLIKTTVDAYMPVFALIALVAYSVSLALIIPGLLQKNSGWRRMAILSAVIALISHALRWNHALFPATAACKT
jgi:ABC-type uncharacterized transport system permease subunit